MLIAPLDPTVRTAPSEEQVEAESAGFMALMAGGGQGVKVGGD